MLRASFAGWLLGMTAMAAPNTGTPVTFNKDVLPILQRNCQACHRPGEIAPMSFLSYNRGAAVGQGDEGRGRHQARCRHGLRIRNTVILRMTGR